LKVFDLLTFVIAASHVLTVWCGVIPAGGQPVPSLNFHCGLEGVP